MWWQRTKLVACWACGLLGLLTLAAWPVSCWRVDMFLYQQPSPPQIFGLGERAGRIHVSVTIFKREEALRLPQEFQHHTHSLDGLQPFNDQGDHDWQYLGFEYGEYAYRSAIGVGRNYTIPHWFIAAALLAWPVWRWRRRRKQGGRGFPLDTELPEPVQSGEGVP